MSPEHQAVFDAALALPEAEREMLVDRLLETLPRVLDNPTDDELFAELERRRAEFERDPSVAVPWSEIDHPE
jgi:putative addiction module component (TIGR02574 family)